MTLIALSSHLRSKPGFYIRFDGGFFFLSLWKRLEEPVRAGKKQADFPISLGVHHYITT